MQFCYWDSSFTLLVLCRCAIGGKIAVLPWFCKIERGGGSGGGRGNALPCYGVLPCQGTRAVPVAPLLWQHFPDFFIQFPAVFWGISHKLNNVHWVACFYTCRSAFFFVRISAVAIWLFLTDLQGFVVSVEFRYSIGWRMARNRCLAINVVKNADESSRKPH